MQQSKNNCPFCDSKQSYRFIFEGSQLRVMYPKNPGCSYHVLIVAKQHISSLEKLPVSCFEELGQTIKLLDATAKKELGDKYLGYNLLSNNGGPAVSQYVDHCHIHMFLRTTDDKKDPIKDHVHADARNLTVSDRRYLAENQQWFI